MKLRILWSGIVAGLFAATAAQPPAAVVKLPAARKDSGVSIESVLAKRRSVRSFQETPVTLADAGQLLWAAQGVTGPKGQRTAPSARAMYPLSIYIVPFRVEGLDPGVYRYRPADHALDVVVKENIRAAILGAAPKQPAVEQSALLVIVAMNYEKMKTQSAELTRRWVHMETGLATQNLLLQAVALDLGTVVVGGIEPGAMKQAARIAAEDDVMCVVPVGKPR